MRINIGPLPPPIGGISTYLYRLSKIRKDEIFVDVANAKYIQIVLSYLRGDTIVFHSLLTRYIFLLCLISIISRGNYVISFYGEGLKDIYNNANMIKKKVLRMILSKSLNIEVVNDNIFAIVEEIVPECKKKVIMKCDRLPPPLEDEGKILKTYNDDIYDFFANHKHVILLNAFRLAMYNNIDLYGVDISIEALNILNKKYKDIGLLFALPDSDYNSKYLKELKGKIREYGLTKSFYIMSGQRELWPLFKKASVFIRPTCTDGDALSIGEAIYFNCPVIASDVCKRPNGVILFKNRDAYQLAQKIEYVLNLSR